MTVLVVRHGECRRCGACCRRDNCDLLRQTPEGLAKCTGYKARHPACIAYPRNQGELLPGCGYWFEVMADGVLVRELRPPEVAG